MKTHQKISLSLLILCLTFMLTGCSVRMAASGKPYPRMEAVTVGVARDAVVLQIGQPYSIEYVSNGSIETHYVKPGFPAFRYFRAFVYGVLDAGTLGLWELLGTPIETFVQTKNTVTIYYNQDQIVEKILTVKE